MNIFQLVFKQMRQRSLSTWLTLFSVMLGVGLAVSIMIFRREGEKLFGQSDYGYDLIIGAKGSKLQLVLNTVYHLDVSPGNIPYSMYTDLAKPDHPLVRSALPLAVGDEFKGYRIVATLPQIFPTDDQGRPIDPNQVFEYRLGRHLEFAEGRAFHPRKFEAVVGSEVAQKLGLKIGSTIEPQHAAADATRADVHKEAQCTVVGILKPTQTASDRVIYTPLPTFYAVGEHESALREMAQLEQSQSPAQTQPAHEHEAQAEHAEHEDPDEHEEAGHAEHHHEHAFTVNPDGTIELKLPQSEWKLGAVLVRTRGGYENASLLWQTNNLPHAMAVSPAVVMREFFDTFLKGSTQILLFVSLLVTIVAAVSILVSIYNSIAARRREIAILRALGATRNRVLLLICLEAGLVGLAGGLAGVVGGHLLAGGGSLFVQKWVGQGLQWVASDRQEWLYLAVVVALAVIAGLVPALKAYRTPVATNLTAE
ncbi:MAG TPA: FtsX-like permease family protein [Tepidisphaeraceae bacterium]|nr:FtsX-like permease family protein [Tepidisphaeraceae bacterium]